MEKMGFVTGIKLAASFLRASAKRFINWRGYWDIAGSEGSKGFSASRTLIQLGLSLVRIILGDFDTLLGIFLGDR